MPVKNKTLLPLNESPASKKTSKVKLSASISNLDWSPNGDKLLASTKSGELAIFDQAGRTLNTWDAHNGAVLKAAWNHCGSRIASSATDETCKIWEPMSASCLANLSNPESWTEHLAWSPHATVLITGSGSKVRLWTDSGALVDEMGTHSWPLTDLTWHPTERDLFATCGADGVFLWRLGHTRPIHSLQGKDYPTRLRFNKQGTVLAYGSSTSLHVWTMANGIVQKLYDKFAPCETLDWSWGGQWLAFAIGGDAFLLAVDHDLARSYFPSNLLGQIDYAEHVKFHRYDQLLACGERNGTVNVWRTDRENRAVPVATLDCYSPVCAMAWNPLSHCLAIGNQDGSLQFWQPVPSTRKEKHDDYQP